MMSLSHMVAREKRHKKETQSFLITILKALWPFLPAFLSGALLVLTFPDHNQCWLAWIGLVPLLMVIPGRSLPWGFFLSFACGLVYFPGIFSWILKVPGYRLHHHAILAGYLGFYFALFGLAYGFIAKRRGTTAALFAAPLLWVASEYLRSNMSFLALPSAVLGHSQADYLRIIQIASFTGVYGISFLIVLTNAAMAAIMLALFRTRLKHDRPNMVSPSRKGTISMGIAAIGLVGLALFYGQSKLSVPVEREGINISLLQGNIDPAIKWDPQYADFIIQTYAELAIKATAEHPELIVWPEASTPGFVLKRLPLLKQTVSLIRQTKTHHLIGSAEYPKFQKVPLQQRKSGNTAVFFSPEGRVLGQHLKILLIPFREYIPYEGIVPWPRFIVPEGKTSFDIPGKDFTLFQLGQTKMGVIICWESIFPGLFREFVKRGANLMVNITNEADFGANASPNQQLAITVFRAVENRISIARAANTGISCFIDSSGRITSRLLNDGSDIFVKGYLTQMTPLSQEKTFYTLYGDVFVYAALAVSAVILFLALVLTKKDPNNKNDS
jgi:apolipoprotein N-acyltransferase